MIVQEIGKESDLKKRAKVEQYTHVDMVEFDLYHFRKDNSYDWENTFRDWLEKGASIDLFYQTIHPESKDVIRDLKRDYDPNLALYKILLPDNSRLKEEITASHFALFYEPKQLWLEATHKPGQETMYHCTWIGSKFGVWFDGRFRSLAKTIKKIRKASRTTDLTELLH